MNKDEWIPFWRRSKKRHTHEFYKKCRYTGRVIIGRSFTPETGCTFDVLMYELEVIFPANKAGWLVRRKK